MAWRSDGRFLEAVVRLGIGAVFLVIGIVAVTAEGALPIALCFTLAGLWVAGLGRFFRGVHEDPFFVGLLVLGIAGLMATLLSPVIGYPIFFLAMFLLLRLSRRRPTNVLLALSSRAVRVRAASLFRPPTAQGVVNGLEIRVEESDFGTTARVSCPWLPEGLSFGPRGIVGLAAAVRTGDVAFDGAVRVDGPPEAVFSHFGDAARALVLDAVARGLTLEDGAVTWFERMPRIAPPLGRMLEVAAALRDARTLEQVAALDPVPGVRIEALRLLCARDLAGARPLLRRALAEDSAQVAREAAAMILADPSSPDHALAREWLENAARAEGALAVTSGGELSEAPLVGAVTLKERA